MNTIKMPFTLMVSALLFNIGLAEGQTQIKGKIMDVLGEPISYASVLLLSPIDSLLILGAVSSENGHFQLDGVNKNSYLLSVSMVGYNKHFEKLIITTDQVTIKPITLNESREALEEIVVSAQKPLYEQQMDRLVINVRESVTAGGSSVLQVLQKSPGVMVNRLNNSISLNGKSGVSVMINHKITRLPIDAVVQMLDGLNAANVEKIELITNPAAKFDAEGTAGIIHIIMQENEDLGTNGN
jgi:ACT domain-containing protein